MFRHTAGLMVCIVGAVAGQSTEPQFEVAAIKLSAADARSSGINTGNGRLNAVNVTLKRCIMGAYGVGPNQVLGGPNWLDSDRFDINAKAETPAGDTELMVMLRSLLAVRFKLVLHRESRLLDAYVLEVARNGPKFTKGDGGRATTNNGRGDIVATNTTMDRFAEVLARQLDLPVVNRTGLEGVFNLGLQWTPDNSRGGNTDGPSVFTAIQEQLGLRLRGQKEPIEVLVIDRADRPTDN